MSLTTENLARIGEALAVVAANIHRTNAEIEGASYEEQARSTLSALADLENLRVQAQVEAVYAGRYEAGLEPDEIAALLGEDELRIRGLIYTYASAAMEAAEKQAVDAERRKYGRWPRHHR